MQKDSKSKVFDLIKTKFHSVDELADKVEVSKSTIRRRLKELENEGINIKKELPIKGRKILFGYEPDLLDRVSNEEFIAPQSTFENPAEIPIKDSLDYGAGFAGTIFAGKKTNKKLFTNFLRYAEAKNLDGVVLAGNIIGMDTKRHSKYKPDRSETSDMNLDHRLIKYPETVKKLDRNPKDLIGQNKPIYLTFKEKLDTIIQKSLKPLFISDESKDPIYSGPFYLVFGTMEEELVRQHANQVIKSAKNRERELVQQELSNLRTELRTYEKTIKSYKKESNEIGSKLTEINEDEEEGDQLNEKFYDLEDLINENQGVKESISKQIQDWEEYNLRITMTNTDDSFVNQVTSHMKKYIIESLESNIPNSKVISTGDAYIKLNEKIGAIFPESHKSSVQPSDKKMHHLKIKVDSNLHQGGLPVDFVIGGGLSPNFSKEPISYKTPEGEHTIPVIQLPTCIDSKACEKSLEKKTRIIADELPKLAKHPDFQSGAFVLRYVDDIQVSEQLTEEFLTNEKRFSNAKDITNYDLFYYAVFGDQHHGSRNIAIEETPTDFDYTHNIAQDLLLDLDAPLVAIFSLGDELQEKNYATETEGHPDLYSSLQIKRVIQDIEKIEDPQERTTQFKKLITKQTIRSGSLMPQEQLHDYLNNLRIDLIEKTIKRAEECGYFGPSYLLINGNHNAHTSDGMYTTSQLLAREIRNKLNVSNDEKLMEEKVLQAIMAPMLGSEGLYTGLFGIDPKLKNKKNGILEQHQLLEDSLKNESLYGLYARHKQPSTKNGDNMRGSRAAFNKRGQAFRMTAGRNYVVLSAHDHMGGQTASKRGLHQRSYCFQGRNAYGEKLDFGLPTIGFYTTGLPVGGFSEGPIVTVEFPREYLRKWAKEKQNVDVKKLFHNSVTYKK